MKKIIALGLFASAALLAGAQEVIALKIAQPAALSVSAGNDVTVDWGETASLLATAEGGSPGYAYKWGPSAGLSSTTVAGPAASPTDTTLYTVTVTDARNCTATGTVAVNVVHKISGTVDAGPETLAVYPNPAGDYFYVGLGAAGEGATVSLLTADGREVWRQSLEGNVAGPARFETPGANGLYVVKVTGGGRTFTRSLVVSK